MHTCLISFSISGQGIGKVKSCSNSAAHKKSAKENCVQPKFELRGRNIVLATSFASDVTHAEIFQALKLIRFHQSFNSSSVDSDLFKKMFPDSKIAAQYQMGATKLHYLIVFGIAAYIKDLIKADALFSD
jgi:hypothetical protein